MCYKKPGASSCITMNRLPFMHILFQFDTLNSRPAAIDFFPFYGTVPPHFYIIGFAFFKIFYGISGTALFHLNRLISGAFFGGVSNLVTGGTTHLFPGHAQTGG